VRKVSFYLYAVHVNKQQSALLYDWQQWKQFRLAGTWSYATACLQE